MIKKQQQHKDSNENHVTNKIEKDQQLYSNGKTQKRCVREYTLRHLQWCATKALTSSNWVTCSGDDFIDFWHDIDVLHTQTPGQHIHTPGHQYSN